MKQPSYAAIILAAGLSSRLKYFKPLLKMSEQTLIDKAINLFSRNDINVYIVTGYNKDKLKNPVLNQNLTLTDNPNYVQGMFSSIKTGVKALRNHYKAFFILPVDIPL